MKLIVFSAETLPSNAPPIANKTRVSFAPKGKIHLGVGACALMELKKGDMISLAQDDEHPERWYIYKDSAGFALGDNKSGGLLFCHKELVKTFVTAWDLNPTKSHKTFVHPEPVLDGSDKKKTKYWRIEPVVIS